MTLSGRRYCTVGTAAYVRTIVRRADAAEGVHLVAPADAVAREAAGLRPRGLVGRQLAVLLPPVRKRATLGSKLHSRKQRISSGSWRTWCAECCGRLHGEGVMVCRQPFPSKQALALGCP